MGVTSPVFNFFYWTNPFPKRYFMEKEQENWPSLPDLSDHFSDLNFFGSPKLVLDPRFSFSNHDVIKKCMYNFAVWRQCLVEKTNATFDEEDPNAAICKKYSRQARMTCNPSQYKRYMDQIDRDAYVGLFGLNYQVVGTNPNILFIDDHYNVVKVLNQYEKGKKKYYVGQNLHGHDSHGRDEAHH
jgi:hypothetical protein